MEDISRACAIDVLPDDVIRIIVSLGVQLDYAADIHGITATTYIKPVIPWDMLQWLCLHAECFWRVIASIPTAAKLFAVVTVTQPRHNRVVLRYSVFGILHADGSPSRVKIVGDRLRSVQWHNRGKLHSGDRPAVIKYEGVSGPGESQYYIHGKLHRENGPAIAHDRYDYYHHDQWYYHDFLYTPRMWDRIQYYHASALADRKQHALCTESPSTLVLRLASSLVHHLAWTFNEVSLARFKEDSDDWLACFADESSCHCDDRVCACGFEYHTSHILYYFNMNPESADYHSYISYCSADDYIQMVSVATTIISRI